MKVALGVTLLAVLCCALSEVHGQICQTSADCGDGYCCYSIVRPVGRRRRAAAGLSCQPRGELGSGCLLRDALYDPTRTYFECPCVDGLTCQGNGMFDMPLGEMGTCVSH